MNAFTNMLFLLYAYTLASSKLRNLMITLTSDNLLDLVQPNQMDQIPYENDVLLVSLIQTKRAKEREKPQEHFDIIIYYHIF